MYAANVYSVPAVQYGIPQQDQNLSPRPSTRLLACSITLCIISSLLCLWCFWIISINARFFVNYGTIFCCIYHIVLSTLAIIASKDIIKYRQHVLVCLGLAIFGVVVLTTLVFVIHCISWMSSKITCNSCSAGFSYNCHEVCGYLTLVHLPVIIVSALQGIIDIIISIFTSLDSCQCCGAYGPVSSAGYVIQPSPTNPSFTNQPPNNPQYPYEPPTKPPVPQVH